LRARSRYLTHPQGTRLKTPLLIPSFSSKGFDVQRDEDGATGYSEVSQYLQVFAPTLTDAFLVSGYDVHHDLLERARSLTSPQNFGRSIWAGPKMLFIDSGLYEYRLGADSEEPVQEMRLPQNWAEQDFRALAARLPRSAPIALINWDRHESYGDQIAAAQSFFAEHPSFLSVFLLKPEREGSFHDLARLGAEASRLAAFKVIGVTEKELGDSILERMGAVAKLHDLLVREEVEAPIHVFGALDPLFTPLYYAAGAEIFDGLSWLRYFWADGVATHRASLSVLMRVPDKDHQQAIEIAQSENLDKIRTLQRRLVNFYQEGGDWSGFGERREVLEDAFRDMESTL
jgi:hypothetical protein